MKTFIEWYKEKLEEAATDVNINKQAAKALKNTLTGKQARPGETPVDMVQNPTVAANVTAQAVNATGAAPKKVMPAIVQSATEKKAAQEKEMMKKKMKKK